MNNTSVFPDKWNTFKSDISSVELPQQFNFPLYYSPSEIARIASKELQDYLAVQQDFNHNFGLDPQQEGLIIGKMFGVLVVQHTNGELGYLCAFSGKLAESNHHELFVPPVYDILSANSFFLIDQVDINVANDELEEILKSGQLELLQKALEDANQEKTDKITHTKSLIKENKAKREVLRNRETPLTDDEREDLRRQSVNEQLYLKHITRELKSKVEQAAKELEDFEARIAGLRDLRKTLSGKLQRKIFDHYFFLNAKHEQKSLLKIFEPYNIMPPAGAGECCAPKLIHYAYQHDLKPIAMAEFWWGASPNSEVRKHGNFYPACKHKCEPILGHMLEGLDVEENPLLKAPSIGKPLPILYEDEAIVVVNKPSEMLSVPGKTIDDSVQTRMREYLPNATGPLVVHRLDMSTSGILLIAKSMEHYHFLQDQFTKRTVDKTYYALLDGIIKQPTGIIDLPLRVDLEDRPRQMVCYEYGKKAITEFKVLSVKKRKTLIEYHPLTGRTHQLRVHSAHILGLGTPIIGDDLYGQSADRLHLHAGKLKIKHPITKDVIIFEAEIPF